ncbi:hypothetical protein ANO11243_013630 [Dothideomycetidae sp. 11243]|nr:hypothetical protein ANO11243_013630 [fungal sp. No.11243]
MAFADLSGPSVARLRTTPEIVHYGQTITRQVRDAWNPVAIATMLILCFAPAESSFTKRFSRRYPRSLVRASGWHEIITGARARSLAFRGCLEQRSGHFAHLETSRLGFFVFRGQSQGSGQLPLANVRIPEGRFGFISRAFVETGCWSRRTQRLQTWGDLSLARVAVYM